MPCSVYACQVVGRMRGVLCPLRLFAALQFTQIGEQTDAHLKKRGPGEESICPPRPAPLLPIRPSPLGLSLGCGVASKGKKGAYNPGVGHARFAWGRLAPVAIRCWAGFAVGMTSWRGKEPTFLAPPAARCPAAFLRGGGPAHTFHHPNRASHPPSLAHVRPVPNNGIVCCSVFVAGRKKKKLDLTAFTAR